VSSYHTPLSEYVQYISSNPFLSKQLSRIISNWECKFLDRSDMVLVHSNSAFSTLKSMGIKSPIKILKNGIDTSFFKPVDTSDFLNRHGIDPGQTLIGYTGRHGYEKNIHELIQIATSIDATVLIAGDGPARQVLETQAKKTSPNILFLGRLPREELPEFYSALDLFIFPSPVETQGIVAIESISCGTPVVGSDQGALPETILQGVTGNHYQSGNKSSLLSSISTSLLNKTTLSDNCLNHRESISIDATISQLDSIYSSLLN
jgi:1,2-diacylglycerol 3-alpha-glucosyltransferase